MPRQGSNLPGFRERQLDFAAHIRNPEINPRPVDIAPRRMQIYVDLFYNNIEGFLASAFPVTKEILGGALWHRVARDFVHRHASESPYFLEISQEFLAYLDQAGRDDLPGFTLELCHYEWVELALAVAEDDIPSTGIDPNGDLLRHPIVVSPLIWPLTYRFPVHEIGKAHQPNQPPDDPTHLVVYRRRDDEVKFLVVNAPTLRLLLLLSESTEPLTGESAIALVSSEMADHAPIGIVQEGVATLERLRHAEILLGTVES